MLIFVETNSGKTIAFHFKASDRVSKVKESIQEHESIFSNEQHLTTAGGIILIDHCTLSDYDMKEGSTICLGTSRYAYYDNQTIDIQVEVNDTQLIKLETEIYTTVKDIKEMIYKKKGIPVEEQHLYEPLDDNTLVSDGNRYFVLHWFSKPKTHWWWEKRTANRKLQFNDNNESIWSTVWLSFAIILIALLVYKFLFWQW